jgi:subtilase-type serine protease
LVPQLLRRSIISTLFCPTVLNANPAADAFRTGEYRAMWGLDMIHAANAYALGYTGKDVRVGVVDDGDILDHPEFAGRTLPRRDDLSHARDQADTVGEHSTNVAGFIAASRDGRGMHGVAYEAKLAPLLGWITEPPALVTDRALRVAVDMGAKVVNGSYAPPVYPSEEDDAGEINPAYAPQSLQTLFYDPAAGRLQFFSDEAAALRHAARHDVITVYAAGNEYEEHPVAASHPGGHGLLPYIRPENHDAGVYRIVEGALTGYEVGSGMFGVDGFPPIGPRDARLRDLDYSDLQGSLVVVVAVGRDKRISSYSNRCGVAWQWCIAAPGGDVPADGQTGDATYLRTTTWDDRYGIEGMAGTSYAAPIVAGSAAVLRQAFPYMTARQVVEVMLTSADRSAHLAERAVYGRGLLDLGRAVRGPVEFGAAGFAPVFDVDTRGHDSWWRNDIRGSGGLTKRGDGTLVLTGNNSYTGPTIVKGGTLAVPGSIAQSALIVERAGNLTGTGTVGSTEIRGTVAPGEPGRPLRVAGDYVQRQEGVYRVRISDDGQFSDRIEASGAARVENGTLQVQDIGLRAVNREYTVLRAEGGVQGRFAPVPDPYVFLDIEHGVRTDDATRYGLRLARNGTPFAAPAATANQRAVAGALDSAAVGLAPYDAVVMATSTQGLGGQFDRWSGEAHASTLGALSSQAVQVRDAALLRARSMQADAGLLAPAGQAVVRDRPDKAVWARYTGSLDRQSGDGNAAGVRASSSGILFGTDLAASADTGLGILAGFGSGHVDVDARRSKSRFDSYVLGGYGWRRVQALRLRYGASYTWHAVSAQRDTGWFGSVQGRYKAGTGQVFAEAALPRQWGTATLEPYAGLAYVDTRRPAFTESGKAGVRVAAGTQQLGYTTLGVRGSRQSELRDGTRVSWIAGAGWRHAYGDTRPKARMRFAQGEGFDIQGAAVARDALLLTLGTTLQSKDAMRMGLAYDGQLAKGARSHAVRVDASWAF